MRKEKSDIEKASQYVYILIITFSVSLVFICILAYLTPKLDPDISSDSNYTPNISPNPYYTSTTYAKVPVKYTRSDDDDDIWLWDDF